MHCNSRRGRWRL